MRGWKKVTAVAATAAAACLLLAQGRSVVDTPHNLSASGPGAVRAAAEEEICVFCHTPHSARLIQPLWNRETSVTSYDVYTSNALDALPGQPTGSSKMCLSCHDGTIALGSVVSRDQVIGMAGGITTLPPGAANLGTDLSDDHPISFRYDAALAALDTGLRAPESLPPTVRLDANRELQCTTCHDAHDDSFGDFLVTSNEGAALCRTCHQISTTSISGHEDCRGCHKTHTAPSGPYLLTQDRITTTCVSCHDGSHHPAADILSDLQKVSVHDTNSPVDPPEPVPGHVTCADCHDPHTMMSSSGPSRPPAVQATLGQVKGVNSSGAPTQNLTAEYEVCYQCHADLNVFDEAWVSRRITQVNTRLEFDLSSVSFHPVEGPGVNSNVPSLVPRLNEASIIRCSDCHGSDSSRLAGGSGPNGVHGSNEPPLLVARYLTTDRTPESASAYALCYRCHERDGSNGILSDRSFPHDLHVNTERTPCSVCHDPHGISSVQGAKRGNTHLINFDTSVVFPEPTTGAVEFEDLGTFAGSCTLTCHGVPHLNETYD